MFELTINNTVYEFNFGMGFIRDLDPTVTKPIDGVKGKVQNLGVQYAVAGIIDSDVEALSDVLLRANKGFNPRLTQKDVDAFIENEETDLDEVFETVLGFLQSANVTKKITQNLLETIERQKEKEAAKESLLQSRFQAHRLQS
jgi:signal recognition particle GTPase